MKTFREYIEEALTSSQRLQRARIMKRLAPKMAMKRKLSSKKKANAEQLKKRARKKAIDAIRKKMIGNKDYNSLSVPQKIAIDKKVELKKNLIDKLTKKFIPKVKKLEQERLRKKSNQK